MWHVCQLLGRKSTLKEAITSKLHRKILKEYFLRNERNEFIYQVSAPSEDDKGTLTAVEWRAERFLDALAAREKYPVDCTIRRQHCEKQAVIALQSLEMRLAYFDAGDDSLAVLPVSLAILGVLKVNGVKSLIDLATIGQKGLVKMPKIGIKTALKILGYFKDNPQRVIN